MPAYVIGLFSTIIIKGMGYSQATALLLTAPPGVFAVRNLTNAHSSWPSDGKTDALPSSCLGCLLLLLCLAFR